MLFENDTGKDVKVKVLESCSRCKWVSAKSGETIDLPKEYGLALGFSPVALKTEANKPVDPGKDENKDGEPPEDPNKDDDGEDGEPKDPEKEKENHEAWKTGLGDLNGIGPKTVKDIMSKYPNKEALLGAKKKGEHFPFRNDVVKILEEAFFPKEE